VASIEATTRSRIAAVLDGLPAGEPFDWVRRVSVELTTEMVAQLFDMPWEERRLLPYWSEVLMTTPGAGQIVSTPAERDAVLAQYRQRMLELWHARAKGQPRDDIISLLAHNPGTATMAECPSRLLGIVALIAGANEAARGALSGCVVAFDQFPHEWNTLRANPSLVSNAVAEIIRWQSPIAHMRRTATQDVEFRGRRISTGDRVVMWYCSGNRDEMYFDAGDVLRVERHNARRHLAFGAGIHRCLGVHVATMQLRVLLEEMLARFTRIELVAEPKRTASNFSAGYEEVLVRVRT
jgi:cytochrome P450